MIQWTELGAQLLRADRAGSVPDVVMLYSPYMQAQVAAGTLLPLNPLIDAWPEADREDVITVPMAYDSQGNLYGLPYELRAYGIMYRSDLFKEAGIAARIAPCRCRPGPASGSRSTATSSPATGSTAAEAAHASAGRTTLRSGRPDASRLMFPAITSRRWAMVPVLSPDMCGVITTLLSSWNGSRDGRVGRPSASG